MVSLKFLSEISDDYRTHRTDRNSRVDFNLPRTEETFDPLKSLLRKLYNQLHFWKSLAKEEKEEYCRIRLIDVHILVASYVLLVCDVLTRFCSGLKKR